MIMSNREIDLAKTGAQHSGVPPDPSNTDNMPTADTTSLTPGQVLRARREQCGMSVQEAADSLHLTRHYVLSLEADSYKKLPGEVFVKGYIRAYAKLLEIDAERLVRLYQQHAGTREETVPVQPVSRPLGRRRDRNRSWIVISGVAFVALAALLWAVNGQSFSSSMSVAAPAASNPAGAVEVPTTHLHAGTEGQ